MTDLETLGNKPGSVIVALGAVKFNLDGVYETFYERVDAQSCVALGLQIDVSTVMWWMKQSDAARQEITKAGSALPGVLVRFTQWVGLAEAEMWGNGASFDNVLLADAYERAMLPRPWKYFNDRCYRTMKAMRPDVPMQRTGTAHNALDDARSQAEHLITILKTKAP